MPDWPGSIVLVCRGPRCRPSDLPTTPHHRAGKILIQRDESTPDKRPKLFYSKLPHDIASR